MIGPIVTCVPNVSEGRDRLAIERLADTVRRMPRVKLMDVHVDADHHRSVLSFLGAPDDVAAAALTLAAAVFTLVDMTRHQGLHPRMGALDVLPFVPLREVTMAEVVALARQVGAALAERHRLPVYFYGEAAGSPARRRLPEVRRGEYEGLPAKLVDPAWGPDAGPARFDPRLGATAVGARGVLVAYNVWLDSSDLAAARAIAHAIRESSGGLPAVQALGVPLPSRGVAQVSMNLLDVTRTSIPQAFDAVSAEAARRTIAVQRGELVGLAPRAAFAGRTPESVGLEHLSPSKYLESWLP